MSTETEKPKTEQQGAPDAAALKPRRVHEHKLPNAALGLDVTADGSTAYVGCMDGLYRVNTETGEHTRLGTHESYVSGVALLPELGQVVSAGWDGVLQWRDAKDGKEVRRVKAHSFWSWRMAASNDRRMIASVSGQYLAGGYKYEPANAGEPVVKVFDAATGKLLHAFEATPPVQSVAFSPDGKFVAAGNLMGQVRLWSLEDGKLKRQWWTDEFTSWGIIKSHCYIGGIFDLAFGPDGKSILQTGMGPMRDPMAGNGRQLWQRYSLADDPPRKLAETSDNDAGQGLMEAIAYHPRAEAFIMAGRVVKGDWNVGLFDANTGRLAHGVKAAPRVTGIRFDASGERMFLSGAHGQPDKKDGNFPPFGRLEVWSLQG